MGVLLKPRSCLDLEKHIEDRMISKEALHPDEIEKKGFGYGEFINLY